MARTSDVELFIATDTVLRINVDDGAATPAPQNMGGWTLAFVLRERSVPGTDSPAIVTKTSPSGGISIGNGSGTNDRATITIADTDLPTTLIPGRAYHATLWRTDDGSDTPLWYGVVTLKAVAQQVTV